jgi:hypothetical protein
MVQATRVHDGNGIQRPVMRRPVHKACVYASLAPSDWEIELERRFNSAAASKPIFPTNWVVSTLIQACSKFRVQEIPTLI